MTDEKKSQIIGIAVMVIIVFGIGIMLICYKNMKKKENESNTTTKTTQKVIEKTTQPTTARVEDTNAFRMVIEDIFTTPTGIAVTGTISQGTLHEGDKVEILGDNKIISTNIHKIEKQEKETSVATKGDYISIILKDVNKSQVLRGQTEASPSSITATNKFKANIHINTLKEGGNDMPIYNNYLSSFVFKIESYNGTITLDNDEEMINPGETKSVTVELDTTVAMEKDSTFSIRENGREIGTGTVTELIK